MDLIAKMGNTRIGYIDIAKCIAIVSVVVCHVLLMDLYSFHDVWDSPLMNFVSLYQMPLFMFLSGLVSITSKPQIGICRDLAKRFRQLFVPFVVFASLFSLWKEHSLGFVFDMFKWGYWYLWVLFIYYIFSYVLIRGQNVVAKYLLLLVVWFVATRYVDKMSQSVNDILSISLIVKYFPYFIVGNFVKRYNLHRILFDNSLLLYIAILVWACKSFFMFHYGEYIVSSAAIIVIMNVCKRIDDTQLSRKRIMTYIGENTLYISFIILHLNL